MKTFFAFLLMIGAVHAADDLSVTAVTAAGTKTAARAAIGTVIGTDVEAWSSNLDSWSMLSPSSKQDVLTFGSGLTNKSGTVTNNIAAGTGISFTAGSGGLITIANTASGTSGTVINTGTPAVSNIPRYTDTTGTNVAPSGVSINATFDASGFNSIAATNTTTTNGFFYTNGVATFTKATIAATPTSSIILTNFDPATVGAQKVSPSVEWDGNGWKTTATAGSQPVSWIAYALPVQGSANPTAKWILAQSLNGGAYANKLTIDDNGGSILAGSLSLSGITASSSVTAGQFASFAWSSSSSIKTSANGVIELFNNAGTGFTALNFGGTTASFPQLRVSGTTLQHRLADNSADGPMSAAAGTFSGTLTANGDVTMAVAKKLSITSGTNQRAGNLTLVGGSQTVNNTTVTANTIVLLTRKTSGGTIGTAITYTVSAATSFTVTSDNVLDTSTFSYLLIEVP